MKVTLSFRQNGNFAFTKITLRYVFVLNTICGMEILISCEFDASH